MSERIARGPDWMSRGGVYRVRGPGRVLTLKGFSSMVLPQRTQSPQASGEEDGVTLQKRGGAGSRFRMAVGVSRGKSSSHSPPY